MLIEILWPGYDLDAGRNSLSTALSSLRHQLEPPGVPRGAVLVADWSSVRVNPDAINTDAAEFEQALQIALSGRSVGERRECLARALHLYRGPLLPASYDDWVLPERQRLEELFFQATRQTIRLHEQEGDFSRALEHAGRAVAADPLREEAHRELIRLHAAAGQPAAALRQYRELEHLLHKGLGAPPSAATRQLVAEIEQSYQRSHEQTAPSQPKRRLRPPATLKRPPAGTARRAPARVLSGSPGLKSSSVPPAGTVTFLVVEVDDPSATRQRAGEMSAAATGPLHSLRETLQQHGGHTVEEAGELLVVAFASVSDAATAAMAGQQALAGQTCPAAGHRPVRMALHTGDVELRGVGYPGPALRQAAALLAAAHGGQILCSEATAVLLRQNDPAATHPVIRLSELGIYRLRNLPEPARLFQLECPDAPRREFPPPNAPAAHAGSLPLQFTRFVGREKELARLRSLLLARPEAPAPRLVTLTGPGGSGKTRLALEAAGRVQEMFREAVWFVPLADLSDPRLIFDAILEPLRITRSPDLTPLEQIVHTLAGQSSLLVLDNFEHLVTGGAGHVRTLLEQLPDLQCLVTSRQRLNVAAETELEVRPLSIPGGDATPEALTLYESVELFVDRAQAVLPDFQVTNSNAPAVAALCQRLEGIPLALELAAARAQVLTPQQMLVHLENRLDFLVSRRRDAARRHRTLREALDWSYQLLAPELQCFFARLSVFRGGWTLKAAETVCEEVLALDYLAQLRECSLIVSDETALGMRFRMLETLREFAAEQLPPADRAGCERRYADYCLSLAEEPHREDEERSRWLDRLEAEHDNLAAALEWGLGSEPVFALRLAEALEAFWYDRHHYTEGRDFTERALKCADCAPIELRAAALRIAGELASHQGDFSHAKGLLEEHLSLMRLQRNPRMVVEALGYLRYVARGQDDESALRTMADESLALYRELGDENGIYQCLTTIAWLNRDYRTICSMMEERLKEARRRGKQGVVAYVTNNLGLHLHLAGEAERARILIEESVQLRKALDPDWARYPLITLGRVICSQGDYARARSLFLESLQICQRLGDKRLVVECLEGLAVAALGEKQPDRAARLLGGAHAIRETTSFAALRDEQLVGSVRETLGEEAFAAAWEAGCALTWQQAAEEALRT